MHLEFGSGLRACCTSSGIRSNSGLALGSADGVSVVSGFESGRPNLQQTIGSKWSDGHHIMAASPLRITGFVAFKDIRRLPSRSSPAIFKIHDI